MTTSANIDFLLESLRRNGRVNQTLLDALKPEDLSLSDGEGGWTVGQHLGHLADFRKGWLDLISPSHAKHLPAATTGDWQNFELSTDLPGLTEVLRRGDEASVNAVQSALDEGRTFPDPHGEGTYQSNPAHFLQHIIVHDSHHRGQIMSLLRRGGHSKDEMNVLEGHWGIWRE